MARVTVVVPTAARPDTLEITLRSIANQTARDQIVQVVVSENLGDERSRDVAAAFTELPIRYVLREPQLTVTQHSATLLREVESDMVAFVCDDDIWFPGHLAGALAALDRSPEAVAHFSAFIGAPSELAQAAYQWGGPLLYLAAGRPPRMSQYRFGLPEMLALSWVFTPFQWSTMVARRGAAAAAAAMLESAPHAFYSDRLLCLGLAGEGEILFDPAVTILYRAYAGNWQEGQDPERLKELLREGERVVEAQASAAGVDLAALWRGYLTELPGEVADETKRWLSDRFTPEELALHGFADKLPVDPPVPGIAKRAVGRLARAARVLAGRS